MDPKTRAEVNELRRWQEDIDELRSRLIEVLSDLSHLYPEDGYAGDYVPNLVTVQERIEGRGAAMPDLEEESEAVLAEMEYIVNCVGRADAFLSDGLKQLHVVSEQVQAIGQDRMEAGDGE